MTGVDYGIPNVKVCQILAAENPDYQVEFICAPVEVFLERLQPNTFDLVLGLNVFHHICARYGWINTRNLIASLAEKVTVGILELALKSEKWIENALPDNYRTLIAGFDYIKLLDRKKYRDNSDTRRPLCFVSKNYVYLDELGLMKIDRVVHHSQFALNGKKYFYCGDKFIKYFPHVLDIGHKLAEKEIDFSRDMCGKNGLPKFYGVYSDVEENFTNYIIVFEKINGITLGDILKDNKKINRWDVLKKVFQWLMFLENYGYCSFDTHINNFIYHDEKLTLIDYEYILKKDDLDNFAPYFQNHFPFPRDYIMQALCLINEIFNVKGKPYNGFSRSPQLLTSLKKYITLKKYNQLVALQDSEDIFSRMYEILFADDDEVGSYTLAERELLAVEDYLDSVGSELGHNREYFKAIENNLGYLNQKNVELKENLKKVFGLLGEVQKEFSILNAKLEVLAKENQKKDGMLKEFEKVINSLLATKGD